MAKMIGTGGFKRFFEFDGKRYIFHISRNDKVAAEKIADGLRKKGFNARTIQMFAGIGGGVGKWAVYKYPYKNPAKK